MAKIPYSTLKNLVPDVVLETKTFQAFDPNGCNGIIVRLGNKNFEIHTRVYNPILGIVDETYIIKGVEESFYARAMVAFLTNGFVGIHEIMSMNEC